MSFRQTSMAGACVLGVVSGLAMVEVQAQAQTVPPATASTTQDQRAADAATARPAAPVSRAYGGIEYLHWWLKDAPLSVPLVSTGPESNKEGFLINPGTTILYGAPFAPAVGGNDKQSFPGFSGTRLTLGYWLDDAHSYAIEARAFLLENRTTTFQARGDASGSPGMRVPVYNNVPYAPGGACDPDMAMLCLVPQTEDGVPLSIPGDLTGGVTITNRLLLWGTDLTGVIPLYRDASWEISGLAGFNFLQLSEDFGLTADLAGLPSSDLYAGQSGSAYDTFRTQNRFYGAVLGLRGSYSYGPVSVEASGRLAMGASQEVLKVSGRYVDYGAQFASSSGPYGIFAMPANEGQFSSTHFAIVPEVQVKLGYDITPSMRITIGYDFLYDSNVIRPGDQINRNLPKGQTFQQDGTVASTTSPARLFKTTDFFAHGINVGLAFRF